MVAVAILVVVETQGLDLRGQLGGGSNGSSVPSNCSPVDDLNASACCSDSMLSSNRNACCAYNPGWCGVSSSSNSTCKNKTNAKPAFGFSSVHTYTDAGGIEARNAAVAAATAEALGFAQQCKGLNDPSQCARGCDTNPPLLGPTFTPGNNGPKRDGVSCQENLIQLGVHGIVCRVDGECSKTRVCIAEPSRSGNSASASSLGGA